MYPTKYAVIAGLMLIAGLQVPLDAGEDCGNRTCEMGEDCANCPSDCGCDDGAFCNGIESCDTENGTCVAVSPCPPSVEGCLIINGDCDEENDECLDVPDDSLCEPEEVCRPDGECVPVSDPCADDDGDGKVTICHIPPGNPDNAHTITVGVNAVPAHLAHGDACGPCEEDGGLSAVAGASGACSADISGDAVVNAADLAQCLDSWGPNPGSPADLNGDGVVDAEDLAQVLSSWGPCLAGSSVDSQRRKRKN